MSFRSTHKLIFEACPWPRDKSIMLFRIGTCEGQWFSEEMCFCIISVINNKPGNGHLEDVFEWFERSCKRDSKALKVMEVMNERFKKHLIEKRGFQVIPRTDNVIKFFV